VHHGALPVWLAPTQAVILPVVDDALTHAVTVRHALRQAGLRVELDDRDATLGARIRDAQLQQVPYVVVVGAREAESGTVSVRLRNSQQLPAMEVDRFVDLAVEVVSRRLPVLVPEVR
jgi:threonyl-tRNA synthetase